MPIQLQGLSRYFALAFLFALSVAAFVAAYFLHSWIVLAPIGLVVLILIVAALPIKRKVTPEQWAGELEQHLLGTGGAWAWDHAVSVRLSDPRLENLRIRLLNGFDTLQTHEKRGTAADRSDSAPR